MMTKQGFELAIQTHTSPATVLQPRYNLSILFSKLVLELSSRRMKLLTYGDDLSLNWKLRSMSACSHRPPTISSIPLWSNLKMCYLLVPWFPAGVAVTAEARQELFLHLSRMQLGQTAQIEICTQTQRQWGGIVESFMWQKEMYRILKETSPRSSLRSSDTVLLLPNLWFGSEMSVCGQVGEPVFDVLSGSASLSSTSSSSSPSSWSSLPFQGLISFTSNSWWSSSSESTLLVKCCWESGGLSTICRGSV